MSHSKTLRKHSSPRATQISGYFETQPWKVQTPTPPSAPTWSQLQQSKNVKLDTHAQDGSGCSRVRPVPVPVPSTRAQNPSHPRPPPAPAFTAPQPGPSEGTTPTGQTHPTSQRERVCVAALWFGPQKEPPRLFLPHPPRPNLGLFQLCDRTINPLLLDRGLQVRPPTAKQSSSTPPALSWCRHTIALEPLPAHSNTPLPLPTTCPP